MTQVRKKVQGMVAESTTKHGWTVLGVGAAQDWPTFSYTSGLTELGHPELLMIGLDPRIAQQLLNDLGDMVKAGERLKPRRRIAGIIADYKVLVRGPIHPQAGRMFQAIGMYGQIEALQMLWPDPQGKFPDDPECDPKYARLQPLVELV